MFATEPHFVDHLAAVWHVTPASRRGQFITPAQLRDRAAARGVRSISTVDDVTRPVLVASFGDTKKAQRMGRSQIAFLEHGIGQSYGGDPRSATHGSYAGGMGREQTSLFLVPNEHSGNRWRNAYPDARVEVIGCPKLDTLPAREPGDGPVVAVSFHFDCLVSQEARSTWAYFAPGLDALRSRFRVLGHGHPKGIHDFARKYRRMGIEVVEDFMDVCRRADLYITDNSSSLYEFASTGRPVVVLNEPTGRAHQRGYRREVNHGLRFWDAADVGLECDRPGELVTTADRALRDHDVTRERREAALDIVYAYRTGAAERAAQALVEWVEPAAVAA